MDINKVTFGHDIDITEYLSGRKLIGDDYSYEQIREWYDDEREAFTNMYVQNKSYKYEYHALNCYHGFRHLQGHTFNHALGIGSARGDEFMPILEQIGKITVLEPSELYSQKTNIGGIPCNYIVPQINGDMPFGDNSFDLILCFGALHHIPNVSHVLKECWRCLQDNGYMLIREPISSMGDWRKERAGLTKRERGIPPNIFDKLISNTGFVVTNKSLCMFPPLARMLELFRIYPFNSVFIVLSDAIICRGFIVSTQYHRVRWTHKIAPWSIFFVLRK